MTEAIDTRWFELQWRRWGVYVRLGFVSFGIGVEWDDYSRTLHCQAGASIGLHRTADDSEKCEACGKPAVAGVVPTYVDDGDALPTCKECSDELRVMLVQDYAKGDPS